MAYPWAHLFDISDDEDTSDDATLLDMSCVEKTIDGHKADADRYLETITELRSVSEQTFRAMETEISDLKAQIKTLKQNSQLVPVILAQRAIAHSQQLPTDASDKKVIQGVHTWLKRRYKIVQYLKQNQLFSEDVISDMSDIIHNIEKDSIVQLMDQYKL